MDTPPHDTPTQPHDPVAPPVGADGAGSPDVPADAPPGGHADDGVDEATDRPGLFARAGARLAAVPFEGWLTFVVVIGCSAFVFGQLHPSLLLSDTTPAGGDMGAHVWGPAYLRDELLSQGRWSGWTPDWYAGFPAYHFYMVTPSILIALGSLVMPYGVAFKLVTVSGVVTMPISAYLFGRFSGLRFPGPALLAVAATVFLFDRSFSIYGGNIASTLAGEFAFSMSLSLAIVYLGLVIRGMRTGGSRGWAALALALCGLTHIIPAFWALAATAVIWLVYSARERELIVPLVAAFGAAGGLYSVAGGEWFGHEATAVGYGMIGVSTACLAYLAWEGRRLLLWFLSVLPVAGLLSAFWVLPFFWQRGYLNDMGWEKKTGDAIPTYLFTRDELDPQLIDSPSITIVLVLAAAAMLIGLVARNRVAVVLTISAVVGGLAFWLVPEGRLWNARLLPFYYLSLLMLVAVGTAEAVRAVAALLPTERVRDPLRPELGVRPGLRGTSVALGGGVVVLGFVLAAGIVPGAFDFPSQDGTGRFVALALVAGAVAGLLVYRWLADPPDPAVGLQRIVRVVACVCVVLFGLGFLSATTQTLPFGVTDPADGVYTWTRLRFTDADGNPEYPSFVRSWSKWNYEGYEGKDAWPEYRDIVATMAAVGEEQGCGRAMWEHEEQHDRYGTPMALMLLPFWTEGCIGSMEGLYFEASATTPYHFLNQDQLSNGPSNAQRDLPYVAGSPTPEQFDLGVEHLQMLGVRYYMAITGRMQSYADAHEDLTEVAASGPWKVYEVADAPLVQSLTAEPAVVTGVPAVGHEWLDLSVRWYQDPDAWQVPLSDDGPADWQRIECTYTEPGDDEFVTYGSRGDCETPEVREVTPVEVTDIVETNDGISFDVSEVGVPVVVKTSYFPNWQASGADGPWRVTPNLMVVVPTSTHVELTYGRTPVDWVGMAMSLVGLVWLVYLFRARRLAFGRDAAAAARALHPIDPFASPIDAPTAPVPAAGAVADGPPAAAAGGGPVLAKDSDLLWAPAPAVDGSDGAVDPASDGAVDPGTTLDEDLFGAVAPGGDDRGAPGVDDGPSQPVAADEADPAAMILDPTLLGIDPAALRGDAAESERAADGRSDGAPEGGRDRRDDDR